MRRFTLPDLRLHVGQQWASGEHALRGRLSAILTFQELRPAFEGELRRSRRYERPLTLVTLVPEVAGGAAGRPNPGPANAGAPRNGTGNGNGIDSGNGSGNGNGHGNGARSGDPHAVRYSGIVASVFSPATSPYTAQLRFLLLGSILCGTLRESDIVGYVAERHEFCALLPECDAVAARRMVERLHRIYFSRTGDGVRAGIALFPDDGLTLDDLLAQARVALMLAPVRHTADAATKQEGG